MASVASPRSPHYLHSPLEFLPVTRFPPQEERTDQIHEMVVETRKEREVIQNQPYRTTPLIFPGAKPRPDLVNNKLTGKPKPIVYRPIDEKSVVANLDENRALLNRQFNSPKPLYSQQNVNEAVYVQTGVNLAPPSYPGTLQDFNPQKSPTFRALLEEEGPGTLLPPVPIQVQTAKVQIKTKHPSPNTNTSSAAKYAHSTAPTSHLNSVGQPAERIAQSGTFRRLMLQVLGE